MSLLVIFHFARTHGRWTYSRHSCKCFWVSNTYELCGVNSCFHPERQQSECKDEPSVHKEAQGASTRRVDIWDCVSPCDRYLPRAFSTADEAKSLLVFQNGGHIVKRGLKLGLYDGWFYNALKDFLAPLSLLGVEQMPLALHLPCSISIYRKKLSCCHDCPSTCFSRIWCTKHNSCWWRSRAWRRKSTPSLVCWVGIHDQFQLQVQTCTLVDLWKLRISTSIKTPYSLDTKKETPANDST